tara:strand:+ start:8353 stop:8613 length:261 start_codon:yes stop_codon:yes gene_type:complete
VITGFNIKSNLKQEILKTRIIGIIVTIIGILMIMYTGFNYATKEKVVDLGSLEISVEKNHPVKWSPAIGAILLIGGVVLIAIDKKK